MNVQRMTDRAQGITMTKFDSADERNVRGLHAAGMDDNHLTMKAAGHDEATYVKVAVPNTRGNSDERDPIPTFPFREGKE